MPALTSRHRRLAVVGGIVGALLAVAGVAVAAFLLTTTVGGRTGFSDVEATASDSIKAVSGTSNGSVDCTNA